MTFCRTLVSVTILTLGSVASAGEAERPNVVLMMDNLGWGEIGAYGGGTLRGAETPRLDAPAAEGIKLLNYNVEPQCTPSRSALMTGRHPIRSGTAQVVWGLPYGLVGWEVTIAELFFEAGYAPWHVVPANNRWYVPMLISSVLPDALERIGSKFLTMNYRVRKKMQDARGAIAQEAS